MFGSYKEVESRIQKVLEDIQKSEKKPNLKDYSRKYHVPYDRLVRRYHGKASKSTRQRTNQRLDNTQVKALKGFIKRCNNLRALAFCP